MLVVMLLALGGAHVASASAQLQGLPHDRVVHSGLPKGDVRGRIADVRAIEAQADALDHVHRFGRAGVGAALAHLRTIHRVVHGVGQRLVDVAVNVGVQGNHLADGHSFLLWGPSLRAERSNPAFVPLLGCLGRFLVVVQKFVSCDGS
jgi:hypothetical protein